MSACHFCRRFGHPSSAHVATCVVCGVETLPLAMSVLETDFEVSPYRKGYFVYDCGDKARHAEARARAEQMAGDPDAPKSHPPKLVKGEKETLRTLW